MVTARVESGSKKRIRTGVAISATSLCAADIRLRGSAERVWRSPLEPPPADGGAWPSLAAALGELARELGVSGGTLAVSLLPPLTEVRRLELPPLHDDEIQQLLARNASRYFVNARGPQLVGALAPLRRGKSGLVPVMAAAASTRLIAAVRHAAEQTGWVVDAIAPAEGAWAAAAIGLWPAFAKQRSWALVANEDRTDLLEIESGRLAGVRRFRPGGADAAAVAETVGPSARVGLVGRAANRSTLAVALTARGVTVAAPGGEWSFAAEQPDALAAHFAGSEIGPVLRATDAIALDRAAARRQAWMLGGAAAAMLALAAGIELWGVHRQLRLVQEERARIRPQIASTLVGRTTVEATYRHLTELNEIERASPRWAAVIASLSDVVPDDAHLTAIRARQDSLVVDGLAEHAARVFDALERTTFLTDVKAAAPVRREPQDNGPALDHFTIAALVAPPGSGSKPQTIPAASGARRGQ